MINILKIILLNTGIFLVLIILFYLITFLSGYGANNNHIVAEWTTYICFIVFHLFANFIILKRLKIATVQHVLLSSLQIVALYGMALLFGS